MFNTDPNYFRQINQLPSVIDVKLPKEDYDHLMKDDLDPLSKNELVYKILKLQLREQ